MNCSSTSFVASWRLGVLLILAGPTVACGPSVPTYTPRFVESDDPPFAIDSAQAYTFGYLEVPENRTDPDSRTIRLPVYIFRSRNPDPAPDPVIYTVGGPGNSSMPNAPYMNYYAYLDDRDLILFEQRGTTYAQPHLACPEWAEATHLLGLPAGGALGADSLLMAAATACRARLLEEGIDLDGYRTTEIAADINDLVEVLGIEQYNLLTLSYSTKIAQVLMRDHPERIRSVVMDSPLPLEVNYDEESVGNLMAVLNRLLADCAAQADCREAFPDLKDRLYAFLSEKSAEPLELEVTHPVTGEKQLFRLRGKDLVSMFAGAGTGDMAGMPQALDRLITGDHSALEAEWLDRFEEPGAGAGMGMRLSVWCAEEYPFVDQVVVQRETKKYPVVSGLSPAVFSAGVCDAWGVTAEGARENEAVRSDIPTLLISGSYDQETPASWAEAMRENLDRSWHLVFPGWRHTPTTYWSDPCAMRAARAFFQDPGQKPVPDCLQEIGSPQFVTE